MNDWRVEVRPDLGGTFVLDRDDLRIEPYMDGPEWCWTFSLNGHVPCYARGSKLRLGDVIAWVPEFREEAIGMTRAAIAQERAMLAAKLSEGLTALAAEDDDAAAGVLDDLRTWGTRDLAEELAEAGEQQ